MDALTVEIPLHADDVGLAVDAAVAIGGGTDAHVGHAGEGAVGGMAQNGVHAAGGNGALGREVLVSGGEAQGAAQSLAVNHVGVQGVGTTQEPRGGLGVAALQAGADTGGADGHAVQGHFGLDEHVIPAEGLSQSGNVARRALAEEVVEAAGGAHTVTVVAEQGEELLGRQVADIGEVTEAGELQAHPGEEQELVAQGGQMSPHLDGNEARGVLLVVQGRTDEAEGAGGDVVPRLFGQLAGHGDGLPQKHLMGAVYAVKVTQADYGVGRGLCHGAGSGAAKIQKRQSNVHGGIHPYSKLVQALRYSSMRVARSLSRPTRRAMERALMPSGVVPSGRYVGSSVMR